MPSVMFGSGTISVEWTGVQGRPGLVPTLALRGRIISKGFADGAVVLLSGRVTADGLARPVNGYLGAFDPVSSVLAYPKQQWVAPNPPPQDEVDREIEAVLRLDGSVIQTLEEFRQGEPFTIRIDTEVLLVSRGQDTSPPGDSYHAVHPTWTTQDHIQITQSDWGQALQQWGKGVSIPLVVPLPETHADPRRREIVYFLREAWQKVDGADYPGAIAASRKALELLRPLCGASRPLASHARDRDVEQRIAQVLDALFELASAPAHVDGATKTYVPVRADAVACAAASAALAQQVFARL